MGNFISTSKLFLYFSIIILFLSQNLYAQGGWQWQNPLPQGETIPSIQFVNTNTGYAATLGGGILKTTNSGANWLCLSTGTRYYLSSVHFIDEMTGFAGGFTHYSGGQSDKSVIIKTTNGGFTWAEMNISVFFGTEIITNIYFTNAQTGFAGTGNFMKYTTNAGSTWTETFFGAAPVRISFINENTGFVLTSNRYLFKTSNKGASWSIVIYSFTEENFVDGAFTDSLNWYIGLKGGAVFKTSDGGNNWVSQYTGAGVTMTKMFFSDANTGYFTYNNTAVYNNGIRKTTNGGATWTTYSVNSYGANLSTVSFINSLTGIITGERGALYRTTNAGVNWINLLSPAANRPMASIFFLNENTGYAGGGEDIGQAILLKTTNKGNLWTTAGGGSNFVNSAIYFTNQLTGFIGTSSGKVNRTTNGGINWATVNTSLGPVIKFAFINNSTGFYSASYGYMFKTTNGGENWSSSFNGIRNFSFVNDSTAYGVSGGTNQYYVTTNCGDLWQLKQTGFNIDNYDVCFVNSQIGYISASNNILKTSNGGVTWVSVYYNFYSTYLKLKFADEYTGYALGMYGSILKTTNAGANWIEQKEPTSLNMKDIFVLNGNTVYVCGENGAILMTSTGGLTEVPKSENKIPDKFLLKQNYPNPFNPSTRINYELRNTNYVSLKVFDLLGKEVATLVNEKQNAGIYAVDFNSTEFSLPSGIYFYTLSAGEFKETKKMVLIR